MWNKLAALLVGAILLATLSLSIIGAVRDCPAHSPALGSAVQWVINEMRAENTLTRAQLNELQHAADRAADCPEDSVWWWDFSDGSPAAYRSCQPLDDICGD